MKKLRLLSINGTALTELAIFGGICIAAIGFLMRVGMQMNYSQEIRMAAMRRCLHGALGDDGTWQDAVATTAFINLDRIQPNVSSSFDFIRQLTYASANCVAGDRLTFAHQRSDHALGDQQILVYTNLTREEERISQVKDSWPTGAEGACIIIPTDGEAFQTHYGSNGIPVFKDVRQNINNGTGITSTTGTSHAFSVIRLSDGKTVIGADEGSIVGLDTGLECDWNRTGTTSGESRVIDPPDDVLAPPGGM